MTVFELPSLLVVFLVPLVVVGVVLLSATQPLPQRVVRRPRDE